VIYCRDCSINDHKFEFCKKAVIETKKDLLKRVKQLKEYGTVIDAALKKKYGM